MNRKTKDTISVQEAMDNLAAIASIDLANPGPLGMIRGRRLITSEEELGKDVVPWLSEEGPEGILEVLDLTYRTLHQHLLRLLENGEVNWENSKARKGIAALMDLIGASAEKMRAFLELKMGRSLERAISESEEFTALQEFYRHQFAPKFKEGESESEPGNSEVFDLQKTALKSFETVKQDIEYELFYIKNEAGKPYFDKELLKNVRLNCEFDAEESLEEDPLLKVRAMQDRDLHASAEQVIRKCYPLFVEFYKIASEYRENELANSLGMAILALFLAANPRYLLQNTTGKSCLQYFQDFHHFLRRAMRTSEYQKLVAYPPDASHKEEYLLLHLTHSLSRSLFERAGGIRMESIGLIHRAMRRGEEIKQQGKEPLFKGSTFWNHLLLDDEKLRTFLSQFPNGPLFKILDLIREEEAETVVPFDPIGQENLPGKMYEMEWKGKKIEVLRIPCPTRQSLIHKVEIVDEFRGFLRALGYEKPHRKHLIINLQDRTSWKEYARSRALESLQMNAEFNHQLFVLTLPKHTDFYYQINEYLHLNQASDFLKAMQDQMASLEECGFFLPPSIKQMEIDRFVELALPAIHELFFQSKNVLTRKNREDFIEIFYQFFILKCIDLLGPNSLSFTCKDAIDTGAVQQATFYAFIQLLQADFSERQDQDFFRWLLYMPALFIRERAVNIERFHRALSALERFDAGKEEKGKQMIKVFANFYPPQALSSLKIHHT